MQDLVLQYKFHGWPVDEVGAPPNVSLVFRTWPDTASVMLNFVYHGKQPTRFAEALWLQFKPADDAAKLAQLSMNKVDGWIAPLEVVRSV